MPKNLKITIASFFLALAFCFIFIVFNPSDFEIMVAVCASVFSIIFICFLSICISQIICKNISPYKVFAIVDSIIGICVFIYAIYDISSDTGWFAGLIGALLLIFVVPVVIILLIGDFIVWKLNIDKQM